MTSGWAQQAPAGSKQVLVLYGERLDLPAIRAAEQSLRETFAASTSPPVEWFAEYFDFARFPAAEQDANLTQYLRTRYAGRRIDLVMPVSSLSLRFILKHRGSLFPGVPVVYAVQSAAEVNVAALPPEVTGVAAELDVRGTVELALRLQPEAEGILCLGGASAADQDALAQVTRVLDGYKDRLPVKYFAGKALPETVEEVRKVPRNTIVLLASMIRDGEGRALSTREVSKQLSAISAAPVYGFAGTMMDTGAVGGALVDFSSTGRQAAGVALKVLNGGKVAPGSPETKSPTPLLVDWRALRHWKLPLAQVPAEAVVMFRKPTLWEDHRGLILSILVVGLAQSVTIAALLVHRARRRRSEQSLRESEKKMNLAAQAGNLGLWMRDVDRGEVWATEKCRTLFGFHPEEALTYDTFLSRVHPLDREPKFQAVRRALAERTFYDTEYRVVLPDGGIRWVGATGQAEYDAAGKPTRMLGVCADITARKESEFETHELRLELAHASRVATLGQLSSALAHELNQPLGAILRNAEAAELFLKMDPPDIAEVLAILADIRKDDQRAGGVIDRMRALLKRRHLEFESLEVAGLVGEVAGFILTDAAVRHVTLGTSIPEGLPTVRGDRVQIQQVLLNLMINAMDALPEGAADEQSVVVQARYAGGGSVEISVRDTGHGIPPEKAGKLFEPFFTTKPQGMGIGLAISRTIIEAHGGKLWAENNTGGPGATFHFTLPVAEEGRA